MTAGASGFIILGCYAFPSIFDGRTGRLWAPGCEGPLAKKRESGTRASFLCGKSLWRFGCLRHLPTCSSKCVRVGECRGTWGISKQVKRQKGGMGSVAFRFLCKKERHSGRAGNAAVWHCGHGVALRSAGIAFEKKARPLRLFCSQVWDGVGYLVTKKGAVRAEKSEKFSGSSYSACAAGAARNRKKLGCTFLVFPGKKVGVLHKNTFHTQSRPFLSKKGLGCHVVFPPKNGYPPLAYTYLQ